LEYFGFSIPNSRLRIPNQVPHDFSIPNFDHFHFHFLIHQLISPWENKGKIIWGVTLQHPGFSIPLTFDDGFQSLTEEKLKEQVPFFLSQLPQGPAAASDNLGRDLPRKGGSRCPFPPGEGKNMEISDGKPLDQAHRILESLLVLSGKSANHIHSDGEAANGPDQAVYQISEKSAGITPVHSPQKGVVPALHGNMEMGTDTRRAGQKVDERRGEFPRLYRAEAKPEPQGFSFQRLEQVQQRNGGEKIFSISAQVNAGENYLFKAPLR
jgi:hypothetical protein